MWVLHRHNRCDNSNLCSFFSRNADEPSRRFGGATRRYKSRESEAETAKILSLFGALWDIDVESMEAIAGYSPEWSDLRASLLTASKGELRCSVELFYLTYFRPERMVATSSNVATVWMTCPPPTFMASLSTASGSPNVESDLDLYIASYHHEPPRVDSITVFYHRERDYRVLVSCSTKKIMRGMFSSVEADKQEVPNEHWPRQDFFHVYLCAKERMLWQARANVSSIKKSLDRMVSTRTTAASDMVHYCGNELLTRSNVDLCLSSKSLFS